MKQILVIVILVFTSISIFAQEDRLTEYPGGEKAFKAYLSEGWSFPKDDTGKYSFSFKIDNNGTPSFLAVSNEALKSQVEKRLTDMPRWEVKKGWDLLVEYLEINVTLFLTSKGVVVDFEKEAVWSSELISIATIESDNGVDIVELKEHKVIIEESVPDEKIFVVAEQMPQFVGGQVEMHKFIAENLKYPSEFRDSGIQGRVVVRFVVEKDGSISDIKVLRGLDSAFDNEAVSVIKSMPNWEPGKQNGREVPVYFTLPISFKTHH